MLPMKKNLTLLLFGFLLAAHGEGDAQDAPPGSPKETLGRHFSKPIDFWRKGMGFSVAPSPQDTLEARPGRVAVRESVFAQPIQTPEGNWMIYIPPKPVLDFLEAPTEDSARAYLAWKAEQAEKLKRAMQLLAQVRAKEAGEPEPPRPDPPAAEFPFEITYFKKPSCPHCVTQDEILGRLLSRRSAGKLLTLLPGERPELWKAYEVRGTPTLLLEGGSGGKPEVLVGLQSEAALEAALARLSMTTARPEIQPTKEPIR